MEKRNAEDETMMIPENWPSFFSKTILNRGKDYYRSQCVHNLSVSQDGHTVSADVFGSEIYEVTVRFADPDNTIAEMECDCPYAEEGNNCKHMAAVLYALTKQDAADLPEPAPKKNASRKKENTEPQLSPAECVARLSEAEVRQILTETAEHDPSLYSTLFLRIQKTVTDEIRKSWRQSISAITRSFSDRHGFIDYRHAFDYIMEMEDFLGRTVPPLLEAEDYEDAFLPIRLVYEKIWYVDMDDDGGIAMASETCYNYLRTILQKCSPELSREIFEWCRSRDENDSFIFDFQCSAFTSEEYQDLLLQAMDQKIADEARKYGEHMIPYNISKRIRLMSDFHRTKEEILKYAKPYFRYPEVCQTLVQLELARKDYAKALELLDTGMKNAANDNYYHRFYHQTRIAVFEALGDMRQYMQELTSFVLQTEQNDLQYIHLLKEHTPSADWEPLRSIILQNNMLSEDALLHFYEEEGMIHRILDSLSACRWIPTFLRYEKVLKKAYPIETRDLFLAMIDNDMKSAGDRGRYCQCVGYLKKIRKYPDGPELAQSLADQWKQSFPRRRAMLEELEDAGF